MPLALLHLGVKNIHLEPTLPAFLGPNVAKVLVESFGIASIGTVEDDLELFFGKAGPKTYDRTIPPIILHWLRHTYRTQCYPTQVDAPQACAQEDIPNGSCKRASTPRYLYLPAFLLPSP